MRLTTSVWVLLAAAAPGVQDDQVVSWTQERLKSWQPMPEEKTFDKIGWAKDIRDGIRLAKRHHRPVFLFTHTGRINTGRC